jgi:hypothetical protein
MPVALRRMVGFLPKDAMLVPGSLELWGAGGASVDSRQRPRIRWSGRSGLCWQSARLRAVVVGALAAIIGFLVGGR